MGTGTDIAMESGDVTLVKGGSCWNRACPKVEPATMSEHPPEPVLRFCLQLAGSAHCSGRLVSVLRTVAQPNLWLPRPRASSSVSVIANSLRLRKLNL